AIAAFAGQLADELLAFGQREAAFVVLVFVMHMAAQKALGVAAMGQGFEGIHQRLVERPASQGVVDGLAIDLSGTRHVVVGFGAAFDLQRVHAHLHQALHMLHGTQILGVHDVSAVFVFADFHEFAGAAGIFQQKKLVGGLAHAQGGFSPLHGDGLVLMHDLAQLVLLGFVGLVLPATGVGAGALVGVALVEVA